MGLNKSVEHVDWFTCVQPLLLLWVTLYKNIASQPFCSCI